VKIWLTHASQHSDVFARQPERLRRVSGLGDRGYERSPSLAAHPSRRDASMGLMRLAPYLAGGLD
jgi:hypothetical protein